MTFRIFSMFSSSSIVTEDTGCSMTGMSSIRSNIVDALDRINGCFYQPCASSCSISHREVIEMEKGVSQKDKLLTQEGKEEIDETVQVAQLIEDANKWVAEKRKRREEKEQAIQTVADARDLTNDVYSKSMVVRLPHAGLLNSNYGANSADLYVFCGKESLQYALKQHDIKRVPMSPAMRFITAGVQIPLCLTMLHFTGEGVASKIIAASLGAAITSELSNMRLDLRTFIVGGSTVAALGVNYFTEAHPAKYYVLLMVASVSSTVLKKRM